MSRLGRQDARFKIVCIAITTIIMQITCAAWRCEDGRFQQHIHEKCDKIYNEWEKAIVNNILCLR